ncbi:hypothetical protein PR202_gb00588 [Eleusine coracana subsp. coracana]|uniref:Uncharacterized protein n=1 Tax=Eleusine coracana subsp. coracana TaxID=191504 RepID=A0AAV5DV82_ELECO|nr:hypothetical protein PR202_gb00588 [Eleusine coracana subsp. coracana]
MLRSGRSFESAVTVEPPTRPVPPSTSTRALEGFFLFLLVASAEEGTAPAAAGGAHALITAMVAILLPAACVCVVAVGAYRLLRAPFAAQASAGRNVSTCVVVGGNWRGSTGIP